MVVNAKRGGGTKRAAASKILAPALPLLDDAPSLYKKDFRSVIGVLVRTWHTGADQDDWPEIAEQIAH